MSPESHRLRPLEGAGSCPRDDPVQRPRAQRGGHNLPGVTLQLSMSHKLNPGILISSSTSLSSGKTSVFYLKTASCCTFRMLIPHMLGEQSPVLDAGDTEKNKTLPVPLGNSSQVGRQINSYLHHKCSGSSGDKMLQEDGEGAGSSRKWREGHDV